MFEIVSVGFVLIVVAVASAIVLGVRGAALRGGGAGARAALATALGIGAWLGALAFVARTGMLSDFDARPPRLMLVLAGSIVLFTVVTRTPAARRLLEATPRHWPIAVQAMRVPIEVALWGLFVTGRLPVQMTFEGRNFDVLVGLTAPVVALGVARGSIGTRGAVAWNVASLGALANIVVIAITTMPGPLHLDWPGISNAIVTEMPFVWLPAFLVPIALFGHVLSLRQLIRRGTQPRRGSSPRAVAS